MSSQSCTGDESKLEMKENTAHGNLDESQKERLNVLMQDIYTADRNDENLVRKDLPAKIEFNLIDFIQYFYIALGIEFQGNMSNKFMVNLTGSSVSRVLKKDCQLISQSSDVDCALYQPFDDLGHISTWPHYRIFAKFEKCFRSVVKKLGNLKNDSDTDYYVNIQSPICGKKKCDYYGGTCMIIMSTNNKNGKNVDISVQNRNKRCWVEKHKSIIIEMPLELVNYSKYKISKCDEKLRTMVFNNLNVKMISKADDIENALFMLNNNILDINQYDENNNVLLPYGGGHCESVNAKYCKGMRENINYDENNNDESKKAKLKEAKMIQERACKFYDDAKFKAYWGAKYEHYVNSRFVTNKEKLSFMSHVFEELKKTQSIPSFYQSMSQENKDKIDVLFESIGDYTRILNDRINLEKSKFSLANINDTGNNYIW